MRASQLGLMAFDVDGVLTDGSLFYTDEGFELKAFNTLDGYGIKLLQQAGIEVAIISGRRARCVDLRAANLGITLVHQDVPDKLALMIALLAQLGLPSTAAGYMGDDVIDLPVMLHCGFSATPSNAHPLVQEHALLTTERDGGRGAVRETCEFILAAQNKLAGALAPYLPRATR